MKWDEIEKKYRDYVNLKEDSLMEMDMNNIHQIKAWEKIKNRLTPVRSMWPYWRAVASIAAVIAIFSAFYSFNITQKNREITRLALELKNLQDSAVNLNEQVKQIQDKLELAHVDLLNRNAIAAPAYEGNTNSVESEETKIKLSVSDILMTVSDTVMIRTVPDSSRLDTEYAIAKSEEIKMTDTLKLNEFDLQNITSMNSIKQKDTKKALFQYKIDYSDVKSGNDISQRPWKLTITYK